MLEILKGPFAQDNRTVKIMYLVLFFAMTSITEIGGILLWPFMAIPYYDYPKIKNLQTWLYAFFFYVVSSWLLVPIIASIFGRVPLPCFSHDNIPLQSQSTITCLLHRNYVQKHVYTEMIQIAKQMGRHFERTDIRYLSAGFPIGMLPPFPNQIQQDGLAISMSFLWTDPSKRMSKTSPSPIGYGSHTLSTFSRSCSDTEYMKLLGFSINFRYQWLFLSWNKESFLDEKRSNTLLHYLGRNKKVTAIFLEPELHPIIAKDVEKLFKNPCSWLLHDDHFTILFSSQHP